VGRRRTGWSGAAGSGRAREPAGSAAGYLERWFGENGN